MRTRLLLTVLLAVCVISGNPSSLIAGWTHNGAPVCTNGGVQENPQIVPDGEGGVFIVWDDSRTLTDIYAQRLDEMGRPRWAADGIVVCHADMYQARVRAVSDGAGGFIAVWADSREESHWDIYAQRVDADGNTLWPAGGVAVCTAVDDQDYPGICTDGANGCIIVWVDERVSSDDDDIYAQRIGADGAVMWTADGIAVCAADSIQLEPQIVPDGSGGAVIVWADFRSGRDVYAQRLGPSGTALWALDGKPVVNIPGEDHYQHDTASDEAGGAFVAWCDRQGSGLDVYLQRIDSSGNRVFAETGLMLCNAAGTQREPVVTRDGYGGAIVAWVDFRNGSTNSDVYAMRVGSDGALLWTETNGEPVCNSADQVYYLTVLPDMDGGGIFAWSDLRDFSLSSYDIYAQRLDAYGQLMWHVDGDSICKAPGSQVQTVMASDGEGGAILAWKDPRNSDEDIYAQRITASGDFVGTALSFSDCYIDEDGIKIEWRVSEPHEPSDFFISRSVSASGGYIEMTGPPQTSDGMEFSFKDRSVESGVSYSYRVDIYADGGRRLLFQTARVPVPAAGLALYQNTPNPFNPSTRIGWHLDIRSRVTLEIFDAAGRRVATLIDGTLDAGDHEAIWDGTCGDGVRVSSGVYLYRLMAGKRMLTRKMVLLR